MLISHGKAATANSASVSSTWRRCANISANSRSIMPERIFKPNIEGFVRKTVNPWTNVMRGIELNRIGWRVDCVPPIQGGGKCFPDAYTHCFTLGCHLPGFQPAANKALQGRHVITRPEAPGTATPPPYFPKPCKGGTPDAESAEVLENIKALL